MSEIDLHTHSTASDGTYQPRELVHLAQTTGLRAIALTDHDTVSGLAEALEAGKEYHLEVIPGCELSVQFKGVTHILGLYLNPQAEILQRELHYLRQKRHQRNKLIVEKLNSLGLDITYAEVQAKAKGSVGRPHLAQVLIEKKVVNSVQEAFDSYLGPKGKAFVPKEKFTPQKAIEILKKEGASVILAHPFSLNLDLEELARELKKLKEWGLDGLEVFYTEHSPSLTQEYLSLAKKLDLIPTGGSDFHGQVKPDIFLGVGKNNLHLPYSLLANLKEQRSKQGLPC